MGDGPNDQGLSRVRIFNAVEASLTRLGTDYIDLYQAHWFDEETPIEETLQAFDDLIHQGKVRYIGASNYPVWRLMQSLWVADKNRLSSFVSLQPHYNLLNRSEFEPEMAELCKTYGLGVIPYSPLAGGFLTGKYRKNESIPESARAASAKKRYYSDFGWKVLNTVENIAEQRGKTISQIALSWLLAQELVTAPIIGPRTLDQLKDNLGVVGLRLTKEEINRLDKSSDWKTIIAN
jgi:aryl-alcohol dehydrogenase-like predicted oxidoreductase